MKNECRPAGSLRFAANLRQEKPGPKEELLRKASFINIMGIVVALALLVTPGGAFAQRGKGEGGSGGWEMGSQYQRM
jgi:hypothetical protein